MKKYFLLTSILALAACGGGSGGGGSAPIGPAEHYATPAAVRSANASVTGMETFSTSADEIVAIVTAAGIDVSDGSGSGNRAAMHRSASAETLASAYDSTATGAQKRAMAELKNMYMIATEAAGYEPTDQQLYNAYVLAGNDATGIDVENLDDTARANMRAALTGAVSAISIMVTDLVQDTDADTWRAKTQTLEGVQFRSGSENAYLKFTLDDQGRITSAANYEYKSSQGDYVITDEGTFTRSGTSGSFVSDKTLYVWSHTVDSTGLAGYLIEHGHSTSEANAVATNIAAMFYKPVEAKSDDPDLALTGAGGIRDQLIKGIQKKLNNGKGTDSSLNDIFADALDFYSAQVNGISTFEQNAYDVTLNVSGANMGLKYADFGSAELAMSNAHGVKEHLFTPYVGGYNERKANIATGTTVTFKGTAVAGIDHKQTTNGVETAEGMLVRDNNAVLTMEDDGSAKLVMNNLVGVDSGHAGAKWNKLTVETSGATVTSAPKFTVEKVDEVPTDFQMQTFDANNQIVVDFAEGGAWNAENYQHVISSGNMDAGTRYGGMAEFDAYGPSPDNPTEAAGRFGFSEEQHSDNNRNHNEVAIYGAFGGKK